MDLVDKQQIELQGYRALVDQVELLEQRITSLEELFVLHGLPFPSAPATVNAAAPDPADAEPPTGPWYGCI